ncbi:N-acetylmuramoyl-L-alanine amidase [Lentibacillus persicus]|uniref:N-acetylmuramoyl-L-alanine amidase n=1 Tax=Lentibacillus persicus TaxID=640948 RepID=A0A1I1S4B5_9BACI|nr:N-acetylmuramoyl-L-alanine amidase [Lentibacillus persicus]SFD41329.1 N-acetylmuramoyl-L-alanine amidase [Lentibacillus persicus]
MKLYLDPGHGGSESGARGNGLLEKDIVLDIAQRIRTILNADYDDVEVKMSRSADITKSLSQRTTEANNWGADYYLSIHCNAFNGSARGYEDYIFSGLSDDSSTARYRDIMHEELIAINRLPDRGKKKANFHVLRETTMSALLTENGFIDNDADARLISDPSWRQRVAQGHVNGLARAFDLQQNQGNGTLYKIIAGSFRSRENAQRRAAELQSQGIESFIVPFSANGTQWHRVQAGAFASRANAETHLARVREAGVEDAFIITETNGPENGETEGYSIAGETYLSPELMDQYVKQVNSEAPELGRYYLEFGDHYGIRGDIAFAQALHETDFLRFTGVVQLEQNNFAGIGATGAEEQGASFESERQGVLAHIQHLYAYASDEPLPDGHPLADPRFDLADRGSAPAWTDLNGKWAVPGDQYGQSILDIYERMVNDATSILEEIVEQIGE